jgi:TIGR03009 family protein
MAHFTRPAIAALSLSLTLLVATEATFGQQRPYPRTSATQETTPIPYAQTPGNSPQLLRDSQPIAPQSQPGVVPQPGVQPQESAQGQPPVAAPQTPPGFPLNPLEQAALEQMLGAWQTQSGQIQTFNCSFDRLEYVMAFGPVINGQSAPLNKNKGELTFSKPDKGSFEIKEIFTYQQAPPPAGQPQAAAKGDWIKQPNAVGEHWVCDGKSVYEFRTEQKQVIERPLPPRAAGESILDGPLPFLFGADAEKLKQKYWMKLDARNADPTQILLTAWPKTQEQAANFSQVDVILNRERMLPEAMQVTMPNGDRHVYVFHLKDASVNGVLNRIQQALFQKPSTPFGWKHVVEQPPVAQAQQQEPPKAR